MSRVGEILFKDARSTLLNSALAARGRRDTLEAAVLWALADPGLAGDMEDLATYAAQSKGPMKTYRQVAVLGYAIGALSEQNTTQVALEKGLRWVAGLSTTSAGSSLGFVADPVALLGIAIGTRHVPEEIQIAVRNWMTQFLSVGYHFRGIEEWQQCLLAVVQQMVAIVPPLTIPSSDAVADVRVAMRSKGLLPPVHSDAENAEDEYNVLRLMQEVAEYGLDPVRAAFRLIAFDWVRRATPRIITNRMSSEKVITLLRGIEFSLKRWAWEVNPKTNGGVARQWHIDHEYHVQNILWMILAPIFPDLTDEEYSVQLGSKNPRIDLGIPSLQLIIEAKFMRAGDSPKKFIEEIAADAGLYLVEGARYNQIIAVIWDDTARTNLHDEMVRSMKQIKGVLDAVVISRPGSWT